MSRHKKHTAFDNVAPDTPAASQPETEPVNGHDVSTGAPPEPTAEQAEANEGEAREATVDEWREALLTAVAQRDEYLAMAQRAQADFENYKRRNVGLAKDARDDGVREAVMAMLPTLDNLERALAAAPEDDNPLAQGVGMVRAQMWEAIKALGCEEVSPLGEVFDPELHNAVMRADASEGTPGTICEVLQKGYSLRGRMLRYAMVKVVAE